MSGYFRETEFDETGMKWVNPSPGLRSVRASKVYAGTCLFENTNISEGRGTIDPFSILGAPFIDGEKLKEVALSFPGIVKVDAIEFVPEKSVIVPKPKFLGKRCFGIRIMEISSKFEPVKFGFFLIDYLQKEYKKDFEFKDKGFAVISGKKEMKNMIISQDYDYIINSYQAELEKFKELRNKYLLYTNKRQ
jgi:uncharacterized protein YbbC (DUF1343 family)